MNLFVICILALIGYGMWYLSDDAVIVMSKYEQDRLKRMKQFAIEWKQLDALQQFDMLHDKYVNLLYNECIKKNIL